MSWHPIADQCKIRITGDKYNFGPLKVGKEKGIVVELPDKLHYFGMHSSQMDSSFMAQEELDHMLDYYKETLLGNAVAWESLQDRGRHFTEGEDEFVYLKLSDILAVADSEDDLEEIEMSDDSRAAGGSFSA